MGTYTTKSKRQKRFLYNLGFEFTLINQNGVESYQFEKTDLLTECINFYYEVRKNFKNEK